MKALAIAINPFLQSFKYLLLTILLMLLMMAAGSALLKDLGFDTSLMTEIKQNLIPFVLTAGVSMLFVKKFRTRKE